VGSPSVTIVTKQPAGEIYFCPIKMIIMTTHKIFVENIKCAGCINTIKTALLKLKGVAAVEIYKDEDKVCVSGIAVEKAVVLEKLSALGYPEKGNNSLINKAKSFVSCAVGRYDNIK
jgi:copper chaperone